MGDDCINLQTHGSARVYQLEDRASFLSLLESQLKCCGVAVDFSRPIQSGGGQQGWSVSPSSSVATATLSSVSTAALSSSVTTLTRSPSVTIPPQSSSVSTLTQPSTTLTQSTVTTPTQATIATLSQPHTTIPVQRYHGDSNLLASQTPSAASLSSWKSRELYLFDDRLEEVEGSRVVYAAALSDVLFVAASPLRSPFFSITIRQDGLLLSRFYSSPQLDVFLMGFQGMRLASGQSLIPIFPRSPPRDTILNGLWSRQDVSTGLLLGEEHFMDGVKAFCANRPTVAMSLEDAKRVARRVVARVMMAEETGPDNPSPIPDQESQGTVDSNDSVADPLPDHATDASSESASLSSSTLLDARYCLVFLQRFLPLFSLSPRDLETLLAPLIADPPRSLRPFVLQLLPSFPISFPPSDWVSSLYTTDNSYLQFLLLFYFGNAMKFTDFDAIVPFLSRFSRFSSFSVILQALVLRFVHRMLAESQQEFVDSLQLRVLNSGLLLHAVNNAFFGLEERRPLSRFLLLYLTHQQPLAISLLSRCLPREFQKYLEPTSGTETGAILTSDCVQHSSSLAITTSWRLLEPLAIPAGSWDVRGLFALFDSDCHEYWLEWSQIQRRELQNALNGEMEAIAQMPPNLQWNHGSFVVSFPSYQSSLFLDDYCLPRIASISVRLPCSAIERCIPADLRSKEREQPPLEVRDPRGFLLSLYARYCRGESRDLLLRCLHVIAVRYVAESDAFFDMEYLWEQLESERNDMLLGFVEALLLGQRNVLGLLGAQRVVSLALQRLREALQEALQEKGGVSGDVVDVSGGDVVDDVSGGDVGDVSGGDVADDVNNHDVTDDTNCHNVNDTTSHDVTDVNGNENGHMNGHDAVDDANGHNTSDDDMDNAVNEESGTISGKNVIDGETTKKEEATKETPVTRILRLLDILYRLLTFSQSGETPKLLSPLPPSLHLLSTAPAILTIVNTLFVDSPRVAAYAMTLLLTLSQIIPAVTPLFANTPLVDALFLQPAPWSFLHVELLRRAISRKEQIQGVLPEPVLMALRHAEAPMFIRLFFGDTDSERIVWTNEMRAQLLRSVAHHVTKYRRLLRSHPEAPFVAAPLAHLCYPQLSNDIYCANLYLRRWIDKGGRKLPNKNIALVFQTIRREWIHEGKRGNAEMTVETCLDVLGMERARWEKEGDFLCEERFWQKWSEKDANQTKLQKAYDLLVGVTDASDGPISWRLLLLVQFQKKLYLCHPVHLQSFLYPAYDLLVTQIQMILQLTRRSAEEDELLSALLDFLDVTLGSCIDNAVDFVKKRGLIVLRNLLLSIDATVQSRELFSLTLLQKTLRILVQLSRNKSIFGALTDQSEVTSLFALYCGLPLPLPIKSLLLHYLTEMAKSGDFCLSLLHTPINILITTLPLLFDFDAEEEKSRENAFNEECHRLGTQLIRSRNASLSAASCDSDRGDAVSEGWESTGQDGEENGLGEKAVSLESSVAHAHSFHDVPLSLSVNQLCEQVVQFLAALLAETTLFTTLLTRLLTKSLCDLLSHYDSHLLLSILAADHYENPFIIWNAAMRSQLLVFLQNEFQRAQQGDRSFVQRAQLFVYEAIQDELLIADVYVRVYVEQKPDHFLKDQKFFAGILAFLRSQQLEQSENALDAKSRIPPKYVQLMLQSLLLLLAGNPSLSQDLDPQDLRVFLTFLQPTSADETPEWEKSTVSLACDVLSVLFSDSRICDEFVQNHFQEFFLSLLFQNETPYFETVFSLLATVSMTVSSTETLLFSTGIWVIFLYSLFHYSDAASESRRFLSCQVLSHWCQGENKARFRVTFRRYLPSYIVDAFTETPEELVQLIDGTTVTPEILWDPSMRVVATSAIDRLYEQCVDCFHAHRELQLDETVKYEKLDEAFFCGGVLIRIFLEQPTYRLHKPVVFLDAAMPVFFSLAEEALRSPSFEATSFDQLTRAVERALQEEPLLSERFMEERMYQSLVETWKRCLTGKVDSCVSWNCCGIMGSVVSL